MIAGDFRQVLARVYNAPEILGLDSNSETSEYAKSVDVWSLGCGTHEPPAGTKPPASEVQAPCYPSGERPPHEDQLKGLSSPTENPGISLLKPMLVMQPEDRPTAAMDGWQALRLPMKIAEAIMMRQHKVGARAPSVRSRPGPP